MHTPFKSKNLLFNINNDIILLVIIMLKKIKNLWKNSFIFKFIDNRISNHFRKKLTNDHFTILCPNCIGGVICHRLGKQFLSPTVNLTINSDDFCSFLENMEYYLSKEPINGGYNKYNIPMGIIKGTDVIPDITLHFTHYKTFEHGAQKWNERKARINRDNLYVIMYDLNDLLGEDHRNAEYLSEENICKLEAFKCNNKVLFTRNPDNKKPYAFYIKPNYSKPYPNVYLNKNIIGMDKFETKFDFVDFLNTK